MVAVPVGNGDGVIRELSRGNELSNVYCQQKGREHGQRGTLDMEVQLHNPRV
jgi:hypothetical protein